METKDFTNEELLKKHLTKAEDSFKTKLRLFLFNCVLNLNGKFDEEHFLNFEISDNLVLQYTAEYYQLDWRKKENKINGILINDIYYRMKDLMKNNQDGINNLKEEYKNHTFKKIFSLEDFKKMIEKQVCSYCGISEEEINKLIDRKQIFKKAQRGWTMEIDRKNSNFEYSRDNCVPACYWCNNAKTDEFTYEEFREIGETFKIIWNKRLEK